MRQAIVTKFLSPTDTKGSRVKATCDAGSVVVSWSHSLNQSENHFAAMMKLCEKLGWNGLIRQGGGLPNNAGYCWVDASH